MSLRQIAARLATLVALAQLAPLAFAQQEIHHIPPWINPNGDNPDLLQPFVDPGAFPWDWQFFAPAEFGDFGNGQDLNTGYFATWDRIYIYVSRPEYDANPTQGDFTWGNRFELGYMSEEDHGWLMEFWHIDGPNWYCETIVERVNVLNPDDEINGNPQNIDLRTGGGGAPTNPQTPGVPVRDRNNRVTEARDYILKDSINVADLSSWELNKTFRKYELHYGSVIEPFIGFRYMTFEDLFRRDTYDRIDGTTGAIVGQVPPTTVDPTVLDDELYTSFQSLFVNHLVGGQFGARWFKVKSRWNLSTEIRAFAFANFQSLEQFTFTELTFYDGVSVGATIDGVFESKTREAFHSNEFVYGGEVRAEAAYEVTRDLALRIGMTFIELGGGIGRGDNINQNSEDVQMIGATFGIDYRR